MTIRRATDADVPAIVGMGERFYSATYYAGVVPYSPDAAEGLVRMMLDAGVLLVADVEGELLGMVGLLVAPFAFAPSILSAHEIMWWVSPDAQGGGVGRALLEAVEPACREQGVAMIQMTHLANSPPQASAMYERMGFRLCESSYSKVI